MRYYTHLAESLPVASFLGEAVHQSFEQAVALGLGDKLIASMIEAQEKLNRRADREALSRVTPKETTMRRQPRRQDTHAAAACSSRRPLRIAGAGLYGAAPFFGPWKPTTPGRRRRRRSRW